MNGAEIVILFALGALVVLTLRHMRKKKKKGGCCDNCSGCSASCSFKAEETQREKKA